MRHLFVCAGLIAVVTMVCPAHGRTRARWVRYVLARGGSSVRLPGNIVRAARVVEGPDKRPVPMLSMSGENAGASYLLAYADYGRAGLAMSRTALQKKVCQGVLTVVRARVIRQRTVKFRGRAGAEIRALRDPLVDDNDSPYVHVRCFVIGSRAYALLQAGTLSEPNWRFFGSFRVSGPGK